MHLVNLSFVATFILYAIRGLVFIRFHSYVVILLHTCYLFPLKILLKAKTGTLGFGNDILLCKHVKCRGGFISKLFTMSLKKH